MALTDCLNPTGSPNSCEIWLTSSVLEGSWDLYDRVQMLTYNPCDGRVSQTTVTIQRARKVDVLLQELKGDSTPTTTKTTTKDMSKMSFTVIYGKEQVTVNIPKNKRVAFVRDEACRQMDISTTEQKTLARHLLQRQETTGNSSLTGKNLSGLKSGDTFTLV